MENPWIELINSKDNTNLILSDESEIVRMFNDRNRLISATSEFDYQIHTDIMPAPFMGDVLNSPIVLLTLNPGWDPKEEEVGFYKKYDSYWEQIIQHKFPIPELPLFCLDDEYAKKSPYWATKLKPLINRTSKELVAKNISVIQFFPYQSRKYKDLYKDLTDDKLRSQKYNFELVRKAIDRNAIIVILRSKRLWFDAIKELNPENEGHYKNVRFTNSKLNPTLSEKNLNGAFDEIVERLK